MTTFYITRYALTSGIYTVECDEPKGDMLSIPPSGGIEWQTYHREGRDFHRTLEGALNRAEVMRAEKIASLARSIEKIKSTDFQKTFRRGHPLASGSADA